MRISGVSGLVSVIFLTVVLPVALIFVYHYWQEHKRPRIGQIRKRHVLRVMRRWILVAITACIIGLPGAAIYYLFPNVSVVQFPRGKDYVYVSNARVETLTKDKQIILHVLVENTGTVEATGYFKDMTIAFRDIPPRSLRYAASSGVINFKLVPTEKLEVRLPFETVLDDWRLKMINENGAGLYFFARGEYLDESGNKGEVPFCRQYTTFFPSNLALCDEDITFEEPEPVNQ